MTRDEVFRLRDIHEALELIQSFPGERTHARTAGENAERGSAFTPTPYSVIPTCEA